MDNYSLKNNSMREKYIETINQYIETQSEICSSKRKEFLKKDKHERRKQFVKLLGRPLTDLNSKRNVTLIETKEVYADEQKNVSQYTFKIYDIIFSGWLVKKNEIGYSKEKKALVVALHGGDGSPELVTGIYADSANYNEMAIRVLNDDTVVFVPQLLLWNRDRFGNSYDRGLINRRLVQQGSSITALEVSLLMGCIDYFSEQSFIDNDKIGVLGLSYGGMYALYLAAVDERIKSVYSSCWFSDRRVYNWHDWVYKDAENEFLDVEVCSLILPRNLIIEVGRADELFDYKLAEKQFQILQAYAEELGVKDRLTTITTKYTHEFNREDEYLNLFLNNLGIKEHA